VGSSITVVTATWASCYDGRFRSHWWSAWGFVTATRAFSAAELGRLTLIDLRRRTKPMGLALWELASPRALNPSPGALQSPLSASSCRTVPEARASFSGGQGAPAELERRRPADAHKIDGGLGLLRRNPAPAMKASLATTRSPLSTSTVTKCLSFSAWVSTRSRMRRS